MAHGLEGQAIFECVLRIARQFVRRVNREGMESPRVPDEPCESPTLADEIALYDHQDGLRRGMGTVLTDAPHRVSIRRAWRTTHRVAMPFADVIGLARRFHKDPVKLLLRVTAVATEAVLCLYCMRTRTNHMSDMELPLVVATDQDPPGFLRVRHT